MKNLLILLLLLVSNSLFCQNKYYKTAEKEIISMLEGKQNLDFKLAIFLVENAYHNNTLDYKEYESKINNITSTLNKFILDRGIEHKKMARNYAIFSYLKEPTKYNENKTYTYDFDDFLAQESWTSMFFTKLLDTKIGNCHSIPIMYKILANEMKTEAHLAIAPLHMYIKHKDDKGQWVNIELTNGSFPTDGFIMNDCGISIEAVKNNIYMYPMTEKESIAYCLFYLGQTHYQQYGSSDYIIKLVDKSLSYFPSLINAYLLKSDIYTHYVQKNDNLYIESRERKDTQEYISKIKEIQDIIFELGYKPHSQEDYERWLKDAQNEKERINKSKTPK